jgi:hypothetical protein
MAGFKQGNIDFIVLSEDDTALLSHNGDTEALAILWQKAVPQVGRIAGLFTRRYPWIDHEDLTQTMLVDFPKIIRRYDPERARSRKITWNKYAYFAFYRAAQDALRREDPLGVSIPQKAHYPSWRRFSEISDSANLIQGIVLDGLNKLDRGDPAVMDGCTIAENSSCFAAIPEKQGKTPEYHDYIYHGKLNQSWAKADSR